MPGMGAVIVERKKVLLGVTGGIAAYKAAEIIRLLLKEEVEVHVAMTRNATQFITPLTLQALSGNPVWTDTFNLSQECEIGHIHLVESADLMLVAPATANILAKAASGIADDLLSTMLCVAAKVPVLFAPAMNVNMYENPITQENIKKLKRFGYEFIEPESGPLACGTEGPGRLAAPEAIVERVSFRLSRKDLAGEKILVSAGPTEEAIDAVRFFTNPSSGKMGCALARAAAQRGAEVVLVTGPTTCRVSWNVRCVHVRSADQMRKAILKEFPSATMVFMAAAVSDFKPEKAVRKKIKKKDAELNLQLKGTPDILYELGRRKGGKILVGFAAETESLIQHAREKLTRKNLDLIVANDVSKKNIGFQSDRNQVKLIAPDGTVTEIPLLSKEVLAHHLLDRIPSLRKRGTRNGSKKA